MKILKGIGITFIILLIVLMFLLTLYCLFGNRAYGIDMLTSIFKDGFISGVKNFFIDIWKGILFVFKS